MILKNIKHNGHINFIKVDKYYTISNANYNSDPQTLYLLNSRYNINFLQIIAREFKITSDDLYYLYNVDILSDTSRRIDSYQFKKTDSYELLDFDYDQHILYKFEQLYQGKAISISQHEIKAFNSFLNELDISCIPKLSIKDFNGNRPHIQMERDSFNSYLQKSAPRSFKIITKSAEYQCNIFGILSSNVLKSYLTNYPNEDSFYFDYLDENNEFSAICSLFNFEYVKITSNNMFSLKEIAEELHINCILNDINDYFNKIERISLIFDQYQDKVDSIDELFECLYNIQKETIPLIQNKILNSPWLKREAKIQELAAFILHVIKTKFGVHESLADLLVLLNEDSKKEVFLSSLVPFIVDKLMANFGSEVHECSFIYQLMKHGIISNSNLMNKLKEIKSENSNEKNQNILKWFLPEISQITQIDSIIKSVPPIQQKWIESYYPSNMEQYQKMRESCEPDDALTISLRHDDVKRFISIVTFNNFDIAKGIVPYNMYEDFVNNGNSNYINYAAAYGAVKCFKYLFLITNHNISDLTFSCAIYGGNTEIIRIVYQNIKINPNNYDIENLLTSIKKHRNDIFDWIFDQIDFKSLPFDLFMELLISSTENGNAYSLIELIEKELPSDNQSQKRTGWDYYQSRNMFKNAIESSSKNGFYSITKILYDIIKEKNELLLIRNISPFIEFGNLAILKTIINSIPVQNKYDTNQSDDWFINSVKSNNFDIIDYYLNEPDNKLGNVSETTIFECIIYCNTENHANLFKTLTNYLLRKNIRIIDKIMSELLPKECKSGNYYFVLNVINLVSKYNRYTQYDATFPFLNAALSESKEICDLLVDSSKLKIDFNEYLNHLNQLSKLQIKFFTLIYNKSSKLAKFKYLQNLLYPAIENNNIKLVKLLLKLNAFSDYALFHAVNSCSLEMIDLILNYCNSPSFVNKLSDNGTALCVAAKNQNIKMLNRLLSIPEIDPSLCDENGNTPLIIAIKNLDIEMSKALIDFIGEKVHQWEIDKCIKIIFDHYNKDDIILSSIVDFLIKKIVSIKNIDPNLVCSNNNSILFYAVSNNDTFLIKTLLQMEKINPNIYTNDKHNTPLIVSIKNMNTEIAELLIKHPKTNINCQNYHHKTALVKAVKKNLFNIIDMLISNMTFDRKESNLKLAFAISNTESLKHLIKLKRLDVNALINNKTTKLIEATKKRDLEMINMIVNHRSFNNDKSKLDKAFKIALNSGYSEIILKFIPLLDDINKFTENGIDLLLIAQDFANCEEMINLIIEHPTFDKSKFNIDKAIRIASKKNNIIALNLLNTEKNNVKSNSNSNENKSIKSDVIESKVRNNSSKTKLSQSNLTAYELNSIQIDSNLNNDKSTEIENKSIKKSDSNKTKTKSIKSDSRISKNRSSKTETNTNEEKSKQPKSLTTQNKSINNDSNLNESKPTHTKVKTSKNESKLNKSELTQTKVKSSKNESNLNESNPIQTKAKSSTNESKISKNKATQIDSKGNKTQSKSIINNSKTNTSNGFNGIFFHLINKTNNNIEKEIKISCSSCFNETHFQPQNVLIYEDKNKSFWSKIMPNNWICFEFIKKKVIPSYYRIRSCNLAKDRSHPKSWIVEGSNDDESWSIIDQVENCTFLNGPELTHLFKIQEKPKTSFKFIRMRMTDVDWYGTHSLMIEAFELFGTLK